MLPTLAQLIAPVSAASALGTMYTLANNLGLTTTAWQPLGMARTIYATMSQAVSATVTYVNLVAQGGYATTAALMVDANGNPITTWMDLISADNYNTIRNPAIQAAGMVDFANTTAVPYTYQAGQLHIKNPLTGATYSNTTAATIAAAPTPPTAIHTLIEMSADLTYPGTTGTMASGIPVLVTPLPGVSVSALGLFDSSASLVGANAETNQQLLARDQAKLGMIAPNGAGTALEYVATTNWATAPSTVTGQPIAALILAALGSPSQPINRAREALNPITSIVTLYCANANGAPLAADIAIVQALEQALAVPTGMTLVAAACTTLSIVLHPTIYIIGPPGTISADAANAVAAYFAEVPIGGIPGSTAGGVPRSSIEEAIASVAPAFIVEIESGAGGVIPLNSTQIPILDPSSTFTVIVVAL